MITFLRKKTPVALYTIVCLCVFKPNAKAQDLPIDQQKFIYFPHPMNNKWTTSIGVTATTLPYDITEELHYRVPAGDLHVIRKIGNKVNLDGRLSFQVLQNLATVGARWTTELNNRVSVGAGNDVGYWFGFVNFAGFKSRGSGWQNIPNVAIGYRFNKQVLLSLRADAIMNFNIKTYAGNERVTTDYRVFSGSSYTIALEQPFYGKRNLTLGFRALYTDFFWQTWPAFESFDRNIFFPQLIIGLIL
ncbi:hypothetical protein [Segetibacter aerophilus]|uniref:Outer membrane protein beta-barrel domain-containing protein n=1 Tax=Segetibacter aerophilus TaxID=670293 RepID=A0A512B8T9_9BACT|nr:hypothetical protein [Segetibacter aerophilus]GEO08363.1 hypothetical protein SAE01_08590 [Segetibacter aerophilus]